LALAEDARSRSFSRRGRRTKRANGLGSRRGQEEGVRERRTLKEVGARNKEVMELEFEMHKEGLERKKGDHICGG